MQTELRYERWYLPLSVPLGLGPSHSEVRVEAGTLHVKMGWAFDADIPLASITKAEAANERVFTWGVHYSGGRWLVNGSGKGLVALTIEPPVQAKVWIKSVTLRSLSNTGTVPKAAVDIGPFHASVRSTTTSISTAQVVLVVLIWVVIAVVNIAYARRRPGRP